MTDLRWALATRWSTVLRGAGRHRTTTVPADLSCSAWRSGRSISGETAVDELQQEADAAAVHSSAGRPSGFHRRMARPKPSGSSLSSRMTLIFSSRLPRVWPLLAIAGTS